MPYLAGERHDIVQQHARIQTLEMDNNKMKISGALCVHADLEDKGIEFALRKLCTKTLELNKLAFGVYALYITYKYIQTSVRIIYIVVRKNFLLSVIS